jgi:hypothetical protein
MHWEVAREKVGGTLVAVEKADAGAFGLKLVGV